MTDIVKDNRRELIKESLKIKQELRNSYGERMNELTKEIIDLMQQLQKLGGYND